ncbi:hypothetical protein FDK38_000572 [Candidozyma auris]|nr:hypothetical protein FDK38_000572 [[Candida] auris]
MLRSTLISTLSLLTLWGSVKAADTTVTSTTTYDVIARIPVTEYVWTNSAGSLTSTQITGTATYVPAYETDLSSTVTSSTEPPQVTSSVPHEESASFSSAQIDSSLSVASVTDSSTAPSVTSGPVVSQSPIPSGHYFSTGSSTVTTTLKDGSSAVIEYAILYTNVCTASDY